MKSKFKPAYIIVLNVLSKGVQVDLDGYTYAFDEQDRLMRKFQKYKNGSNVPEDIWVIVDDMPLNYFIKICKKIKDEDLFLMGASAVFKDINLKQKGARRHG